MNRRNLLRLTGSAALWAFIPPLPRLHARAGVSRHLFFYPDDAPHIRENARTPLLRATYDAWSSGTAGRLRQATAKMNAGGNLIYDFRDALEEVSRASVVQIVEPDAGLEAALIEAVRDLTALPAWDYFLDGGTDIIGIMRSSMANARLLFAREVLGDALDPALDDALLEAVAEKGCEPCYRTVYGMDHPETVRGWGFDENHEWVYDLDMSRWPEILGANNLRAIPTHGLGLGALALEGRDDRAEKWLEKAVSSSRRFLGFLSPDGSYFEGLSYIDYSLNTLLTFLDAHQRLHGTIDWWREANFEGVAEFSLAMQAGFNENGTQDIVNFSDARRSVYPGVTAWIARETGSGVAQWATNHIADPGFYLDFLWYDPLRPSAQPPDSLKNRRLDLDWIICRTGWEADDAVLAFRSGDPANHEHADRNSFLYKIYGERLLTDHFDADYDARNPGWLLRLTEAHNAVLIDRQGHQYHQGEEGTNAGLAEAHVVYFEDEGERVWWSSDATHGYHLVNDNVASVMRTVAFAKPDVIVLMDRVMLHRDPARLDVRFFPDNRDDGGSVSVTDRGFVIERPRANLHGFTFGTALDVQHHRLDLPEELGIFPFAEVTSPDSRTHEVLTVLIARREGDPEVPEVTVGRGPSGWTFEIGELTGRIDTTGEAPRVEW